MVGGMFRVFVFTGVFDMFMGVCMGMGVFDNTFRVFACLWAVFIF